MVKLFHPLQIVVVYYFLLKLLTSLCPTVFAEQVLLVLLVASVYTDFFCFYLSWGHYAFHTVIMALIFNWDKYILSFVGVGMHF